MADPRLAAWCAAEGVPFAMEVVAGTEADRKGGHIARRIADGRLVLRETAQADDPESFRDFRRWRFYNSNNLWVGLRALRDLLDAGDGVIDLPLIVNRKRVDPSDPESPEVVQLETAMGAAIGAFDGARAIEVPRTRFAPVKTTDDLLVLRSDVYRLGDGRARRAHPRRRAVRRPRPRALRHARGLRRALPGRAAVARRVRPVRRPRRRDVRRGGRRPRRRRDRGAGGARRCASPTAAILTGVVSEP